MSPRGIVGAGVAAAGVAAGTATAVGVGALARRRAGDRRALSAPDELDPYQHTPDVELTVTAEDGVALHVEVDEPDPDAEPSDIPRPTVVLCHGYTLNLRSWVIQRRALVRAGFRVVAWDQRGHGRSGRPSALSCDVDELGRDLGRVLAEVVPEGPLALVGHSMGGMTVMAYGEQHPDVVHDRVLAVALIATSAGGGRLLSLGFGEAIGALVARVGPGLLGRLAAQQKVVTGLRRLGRDVESYFVERYSFGSPVDPATVRFTADMIFGTPLDVMADFLPTIDRLDKRAALEAFHGVEALVLNGDRDRLTPPDHSADIVRRLPGAEHVVVEDAGHIVLLEHPHLVTEQLLGLIERGMRAAAEGIDVERKPRVRLRVTDVARRRRSGGKRAS